MQTSVYARGAVEIDQAWSRVLASATVIALHATAFGLLLTQVVVPMVQAPPAPEEVVIDSVLVPQPKLPDLVIKTDRVVERPSPERILLPSRIAINNPVFDPVVQENSWAAEPTMTSAQSPSSRATGNDREASADTTVITADRPVYPRAAILKGWQGVTTLRVTVNRDGQAVLVQVHRSSGFAVLDRAAAAAVRKWRFNPAIRDGVSVESAVLVPFEFKLDD